MIEYVYRTTPGYISSNEDMEFAASEINADERTQATFLVQDVGEFHDGLSLTVQLPLFGDDLLPETIKYCKSRMLNSDYLDLATVYLTEKQGRELATAILQALDMRKFDDED